MNKISLLHPTFFREGGLNAHREKWLASSSFPERIEYLVAVTETDFGALRESEGLQRVIVRANEATSTSVANWNRLAKMSTGDLLFAIADDLEPASAGWDDQLDKILKLYDPTRDCFAVKISDHYSPSDVQLRHPLVSRQHFRRHGFFDPRFSGMYVDRDKTLSSFWGCRIFDARAVLFEHKNPLLDAKVAPSRSFLAANRASEYRVGKETFDAKWPPLLQSTRVRLIDSGLRPSLKSHPNLVKVAEAFGLIWRGRAFWPLRRALLAASKSKKHSTYDDPAADLKA